jgi:lipopolysaccharide biosynthesis glycosyltransferase
MERHPNREGHRIEEFMESHLAVVALCSDAYMEAPLHVAASSVLRSLHPGWKAKFYLLTENITPAGVRRLRQTLNRCERPYELVEIADADTTVFHRLRPFHGTYTTYYRFLLPDFVAEERFLYLDTDTVTTLDISPLFDRNMGGYPLGFVVDGTVKHALEHKFFMEQGAAPDDPAFNAGVALFDAREWREQNCFSRIMDFCNAHPDRLLSADQTALNVLFAKHCHRLDPAFNVKLSTVVRTPVQEQGIYHFVGSPKPWDILGEFIHPYSSIWSEAAKGTSLSLAQRSAYLDTKSWVRFSRIAGGYHRILRQRREIAKARRSGR